MRTEECHYIFIVQLLFVISVFRWYVPLSSSSSSSQVLEIILPLFWHQSSLTYSVGIVSSTNSQPKQHFEQLAPVQSLHIFGLCPRNGWRFSESVDSEGFSSYLAFQKLCESHQRYLVISREALPSTDIIYFYNASKMDMIGTSSRSYSSRFSTGIIAFFSFF